MYLKFSELDKLNKHLRRIEEQAILIQKHVRGFQARKRYRKLRQQRNEDEAARRKVIEEMTLETLKHRNNDRIFNDNLKLAYNKDNDDIQVSRSCCSLCVCLTGWFGWFGLLLFLLLLFSLLFAYRQTHMPPHTSFTYSPILPVTPTDTHAPPMSFTYSPILPVTPIDTHATTHVLHLFYLSIRKANRPYWASVIEP